MSNLEQGGTVTFQYMFNASMAVLRRQAVGTFEEFEKNNLHRHLQPVPYLSRYPIGDEPAQEQGALRHLNLLRHLPCDRSVRVRGVRRRPSCAV